MIGAAKPATVTIVAPVRPGSEEALGRVLQRMSDREERPFSRVGSTHFARFVLIGALLDGDGEPADPQGSYLLLGADFDGSRASWISALAARIGAEIDAVLGHCVGYPGSADAAAFGVYLRRHDVGAGFSVISYKATVDRIRRTLALQHDLRDLAQRARRMTARELQDEWTRRFVG